MKLRNVLSMVLACLLTIGLAVPVHAAEVEVSGPQSSPANTIVPFASGSFNLNIPAKTSVTADTSLPLEAGDYVTIKLPTLLLPQRLILAWLRPAVHTTISVSLAAV